MRLDDADREVFAKLIRARKAGAEYGCLGCGATLLTPEPCSCGAPADPERERTWALIQIHLLLEEMKRSEREAGLEA